MEKVNQIRILFYTVYFVFVPVLFCTEMSIATDTLSMSQLLNFSSTLISPQNKFLLGFFRPGNSKKIFLGIWFNTAPTQYVWIANRENPLNDTSGVFKIGNDGNLVIVDRAERVIWSTGVKNLSSRDMVAQILDSGNLVLRESKDATDFIWQSFDYPSHAILPGMTTGWDSRTGLIRKLTSWKNVDDPSPGEYTFGYDLHGLPQLVIQKGDSKHYRSGPWNGIDFGGISSKTRLPFVQEYTINTNEASSNFRPFDNSSLLVAIMSYLGRVEILQQDKTSKDWRMLLKIPLDTCGDYGFCGPNAVCSLSISQFCSCLSGYVPANQQDWDVGQWSGGCKLESSFNCSQMVQFKQYDDVKMPDLLQFKVNTSMTLDNCRAECLKNCSCVAYANSNATGGGNGCLLWYGELMDITKLTQHIDQKLFIRVTSENTEAGLNSKKKWKIVIIVAAIVLSTLLLLGVSLLVKWWNSQQKGTPQNNGADEEKLELPCFDIITVSKATQNFANMNKIGAGGFGPVYKGKLPSGQEIAVKRMSEDSNQGLNEFKNEVMLIAKLQHRNLVRLLGCCIHGQERMLIYEFMPNGSLDSYIFGNSSMFDRHYLDWRRRVAIIVGIARGLLYLHRDSRLRIVHRDLKASNVLLDSEMNPKISDFGMARTFREDQLSVKTRRVVGTYGYMAPEYFIDGVYSMKSDVFSFGVLVLEIVCGKNNNQFQHPDHDYNLVGHAWKLFLESRASDLIDPLLEEDSFQVSEVIRCIKIGLLCVQQRSEYRPTMESVISMLDSESAMLAQPKRPGYYTERNTDEADLHSTVNNMTNSMIYGR